VTWKFIPDNSTILQQLRTGEVNAAFYADPAYLQQYRAIPGMVVARTPIAGTAALYFNTQDPLVRDVRVRRAIVEAIDIPRLVHDATRGGEISDDAGAGLFSWAYDPSAQVPSQNITEAKALLAATGHRTMTLHFILENGDAEGEQVGLALQQELRPLGITVVLRTYTPVEFMAPAGSGGPVFGGRFQMAFLQFLTGTDPNGLAYFGCSEVAPQGFNLSRFCDPVIERAFQADAQTYDRAARLRYLAVAQRRFVRMLPFVPLWHRRAISVYPQWLSGVRPSPITPYWNIGSWSIHGP
jgi:peptide/nickel transport system substrate-binding protein